MALYRLLRSNKESGPYSLNDLLTLGLKPYDLVWVDGRSAAWRYAGEVAELKEYAPATEEQPFDRFFKKPSGTEPVNPTGTDQKPTVIQVENFTPVASSIPLATKQEIPVVAAKTQDSFEPKLTSPSGYAQKTPDKKVFVSMPETNIPTSYQNPYNEKQKPFSHRQYEQYLPNETIKQNIPQPVSRVTDQPTYSPINITESDESRLETKYSQSLDDIKDMYINTLVQRKTKNRKKEFARKYLKPAALPALLIIVGVGIGYLITSQKQATVAGEKIAKITPQAVTPQTVPVQDSLQPVNEDPIDNGAAQNNPQKVPAANERSKEKTVAITDNKTIVKKIPAAQVESNSKAILPAANKISIVKAKEKSPASLTSLSSNTTTSHKQLPVTSTPSSSVAKHDVEVDPGTGERKSVTRNNGDLAFVENNSDDANEHTTSTKKTSTSDHHFLDENHNSILDLVKVKSNNYIRGAFGGIRGLELTVSNSSGYLLDEVNVELQIMKPSEQPLRTDVITFKNIAANGTVTVKVPDSQRGIRVDYRITNIGSRQWEKKTAGF